MKTIIKNLFLLQARRIKKTSLENVKGGYGEIFPEKKDTILNQLPRNYDSNVR